MMQNFIYKLQRFMYGRNGIDGFSIGLIVASFVLRSVSIISRNMLLYLITFAIFVFAIYRILSKNVWQRRKENDFFMKYYNIVAGWFKNSAKLSRERAKVRPTHKIYVCPKCKRYLKVPKGKGKIEIKCPCSYSFIKRT